jgi:hypothetical protein
MAVNVSYIKYTFEVPTSISNSEYEFIKNDFDSFLINQTSEDKELYKSVYRRKCLYFYFSMMTVVISLIIAGLGNKYKVEYLGETFIYVFLVGTILSFIFYPFYLSSESFKEKMLAQEKFYGELKVICEKASDYNDFLDKYKKWSKYL